MNPKVEEYQAQVFMITLLLVRIQINLLQQDSKVNLEDLKIKLNVKEPDFVLLINSNKTMKALGDILNIIEDKLQNIKTLMDIETKRKLGFWKSLFGQRFEFKQKVACQCAIYNELNKQFKSLLLVSEDLEYLNVVNEYIKLTTFEGCK